MKHAYTQPYRTNHLVAFPYVWTAYPEDFLELVLAIVEFTERRKVRLTRADMARRLEMPTPSNIANVLMKMTQVDLGWYPDFETLLKKGVPRQHIQKTELDNKASFIVSVLKSIARFKKPDFNLPSETHVQVWAELFISAASGTIKLPLYDSMLRELVYMLSGANCIGLVNIIGGEEKCQEPAIKNLNRCN